MPRQDSDRHPTPRFGLPAWLLGLGLGVALGWGSSVAETIVSGTPPAPAVASPLTGSVPAQGTHTAQFAISETGRYAITVASPQGTALQLVDRAAGPLAEQGQAGKADGRFDGFLEAGDYRIRLLGDEKAEGEAQWKVHPFQEVSTDFPLLEEARLLRSELADFQQQSYALELTSPQVVFLEAAGRHLADLRIWRDGSWLMDAPPETGLSEPHPGQPLSWRRLQVRLEPGRYRVVAYGGPGEKWAEESSARPLFMRLGLPKRSLAGRGSFKIGDSGVDRWLVPGKANYYRLEIPSDPNQNRVELSLMGFDPNNPGIDNIASTAIDKKLRVPVVGLERTELRPYTLVEVRGPAGQSYILQHFEGHENYSLPQGRYWLSTIHTGYAGDRIDATALLVRHVPQRDEFVADRAMELNGRQGWSRRFNLLDPVSLHLHVSEAGSYRVTAEGVEARYRLEPFFSYPPPEFRHPAPVTAGHVWKLDAGYYVLDIFPEPNARGIVQVTLAPDGGKANIDTPRRASARFGEITVNHQDSLTLYLNRIPGTRHGLVLRELPVDLSQGLPVDLLPGEEITIPVSVPEAGLIQAIPLYGRSVPLKADNKGWAESAELSAGVHKVSLRAGKDQKTGLALDLVFTPARLAQASGRTVASAWFNSTPPPPDLLAGEPRFLDLERLRSADFTVQVKEPGLYRVESTGLLETAGALRTPTRPQLTQAQANGSGRNALIQQYLGAGPYRFTLTAQGQSAGHAGVQLARTPLLDGGLLDLGNPARATLPAGQALAFRFRAAERGHYRLHALGLQGDFPVRIEDAEGWPVVRPDVTGEQILTLEPGDYRLIVLPRTVTSRVVAQFEKVPEPLEFEGHGPHTIPLDASVEHLWREPAPDQPRSPDQWEFDLPAPAKVTITVDNDMRGELTNLTGLQDLSGLEVASGRDFRKELLAGRYRLSLVQRRPNNRVPYALSLSVEELLPGQSRQLHTAGTIPISVGRDGLAELFSVGANDVQARLYDAAGRFIAASDDRTDDWNFHIAQPLAPGRYRLEVSGTGEKPLETTVHLRTPTETADPPLAVAPNQPVNQEVRGDGVHLYPLELPAGANLLRIAVDADEAMGMSLEQKEGSEWKETGARLGRTPRLELPLNQGKTPLRLRLWAVDQRHGTARLRVEALDVPVLPESQLATGMTPMALEDCAIAAVRIDRPGTFRLAAPEGLRAGGTNALEPLEGALVSISGDLLWLASDQPQLQPFRAERLRIGADEATLHLAAGQRARVEPAPGDGPLLAIARSRDGQPGLRLTGGLSGTDADHRIAIAAAPAAGLDAAVELRNAGDEGPLRATLQLLRFTSAQARPAANGVNQGELHPATAERLSLPGGAKRAVITLPPATAALFLKAEQLLSTHWSGDAGLTEGLVTEADALLLLPAAQAKAGYRLELLPAPEALSETLSAGGLWHRAQPAAGVSRLRIEAAGRLHSLGAERALFLADEGAIREGSDIAAPGPGTLILHHGPGILAAWSEGADGGATETATALNPPATIPLQGERQVFRFDQTSPALLHLSGDSPMILRWHQGDEDRVAIQPFGAGLDLYAPAEGVQITLHPLGSALTGQLRVTATPVEPVGEGMGAERLLPPGGAIAYGFTLDRPRKLGIGLHASADTLRGTLLDAGGRRLGEGIVHYRELQPGTYLLLAQVPQDAAPTRVAPVVHGLVPGDYGPPPELIRRFIQAGADAGILSDPPPPPPVARSVGSEEESEATGEEEMGEEEGSEGEGEAIEEGDTGETSEETSSEGQQ